MQGWFDSRDEPSREELRGQPQVYHCYAQVLRNLIMGEDQILKYRAETFMGKTDHYLVPEDKKLEVFQMVHEIPRAGHFGIKATAAMALQHFWYPGLIADIRIQVNSCVVCIQKDMKAKVKAGAHVAGTSGFPGQTLYIDLVLMPPSSKGYYYIIHMEDGLGKLISMAPVKTKHAWK
ncbi:MAG: hypothetical protein GY696_18350 [Gammaproteobacteria bacterium]|nr:hypothetical protein [Gammaproteobacteria bacterium]